MRAWPRSSSPSVADALGEVERGVHAQILARLDIDVPATRVWGDEHRRIGRSESECTLGRL